MDLVISSCTSVAHASAALGKPTWIVIPILGYYIWAYQLGKDEISQGEYTSYYENTRVFRQEKYGKWEEPFENIKKGLVNIVNSRIGKSN